MSWVITGTEKTPVEALEYLRLVELADGQALETGVRDAVISLVTRLKLQSLWAPIQHIVLLCAARTLSGALVPLKGARPINNNFVSDDYSRTAGLQGNGTNKWLQSGFAVDTIGQQDSKHLSVWATQRGDTTARSYIAGVLGGANSASLGVASGGVVGLRGSINPALGGINTSSSLHTANGFFGVSRSGATTTTFRGSGLQQVSAAASAAPNTDAIGVFAQGDGGTLSNARIAAYTAGSNITLSSLDTELATFFSALATALT
jgi:hypothetical protein